MRKILFILLTSFAFTNAVKANEWQEELLEGDNVEMEYRYRLYKDKKEGEYIRKGADTDYQYEEAENIRYSEYTDYQTTCPNGDGYEVEYATKYVYQEILPVLYIKVNNLSEHDLTVKNIEFKDKNNIISYKYISCNLCSSDKNTINPGGTLLIKLEHSVRVIDLTLILEFFETETEAMYELVYSANSRFSAANLIALIQGNTNITNYKYNNNFYLYPNYSSLYVGYNIEKNNLIKIKSEEEVCRIREIMTYHYNILKEYYDNNYYKDISDLKLTEEEKMEYKKDLDDYKIFYRYKEDKLDLNFDNETDNFTDSFVNFTTNELIPVKTGIYEEKINYNYLIIFGLNLILISLFLYKIVKIMSYENVD